MTECVNQSSRGNGVSRTVPGRVRKCTVCGSTSLISVMTTQECVRCTNCGFISSVSVPSLEELVTVYHDWKNVRAFCNLDVLEEYKPVHRKRIEILRKYVLSGRLLDVGCGAGHLLYAAREAGFYVEGIDINPIPVKWGKNNLSLPIGIGTLRDVKYEEGYFQAIYLSQVLEHVTDPRNMLVCSNSLLQKKGVLHICTPNASALLFSLKNLLYRASLHRKYSAPVFPPIHLHGFTPKCLSILLRRTGFEILDISTVPMGDKTYYPYTWRRELTAKRILEDLIDGIMGRFVNRGQLIVVYARKARDL